MNLSIFHRTIIGGFAALIAWALITAVSAHLGDGLRHVVSTAIIGLLVSAANAAAREHFSGPGVRAIPVAISALIGFGGGALAGGLVRFIQVQGSLDERILWLATWVLVGVASGVASGVAWPRVVRQQIKNGFIAGVVGGVLGALIRVLCVDHGATPFVAELLLGVSFIGLGSATALAVAIVPVLASGAVLKFVESADPTTHRKLTVHDTIPIGREAVVLGRDTDPIPEASEVGWIPDAACAGAHLVIAPATGGYDLLIPSANRRGNDALKPVLVDGHSARHGTRLRSGALLTMGNTTFRFEVKR